MVHTVFITYLDTNMEKQVCCQFPLIIIKKKKPKMVGGGKGNAYYRRLKIQSKYSSSALKDHHAQGSF